MDNDFEAVRLNDGSYTYKTVETGELFTQRFNYASPIKESFGVVLDDQGMTYFNPYTKELCKSHFKLAFDISNGVAVVDDEQGRTFFVPNGVDIIYDERGRTFFVPKNEHLFKARFSSFSNDFNMENALKYHPEDFEFLPTVWFRDESQIRKCLNSMAEGLREKCSTLSSIEEIKRYTEEVKSKILNKIQKEKKTIRLEDKVSNKRSRPHKKDVIIKNAAADIKDLERIM